MDAQELPSQFLTEDLTSPEMWTPTACVDGEACDNNETVSLHAGLLLKIIYIIIGSVGIIGNLFVIIVIFNFKKLRSTVTNKFIVNQSVIDFCASFFIIVSAFPRNLPSSASSLGKEVVCRLWLSNLPMWVCFVASTYNVVMMTIERYIAIVYPLKPEWRITHTKAYILMAFTWLIGIINQLTFIVPSSGITEQGQCTINSEWPNNFVERFSGAVIIIFIFALPLFVNSFINIHIILVLRAHTADARGASDNRRSKMLNAQKNVVKTLILVFLANVLCWIWNTTYVFLYHVGYDRIDFQSGFYHFSVIAVFANSCLNPFVYAIKYEPFQRASKQLFQCEIMGGHERHSMVNSSSVTIETVSEAIQDTKAQEKVI